MNTKLIAPLIVIIAMALKQYLGLEFTDTQIEDALNVIVEIAAGVWAAFTHPKTEVK